MSKAAVLDKPEVIEKPKFVTFSDRCDQGRCGAAAQQRATKGKTDLLFCNHHGNRHALTLVALGFLIERNEESLCTCLTCVPGQAIDENGNTVLNAGEDEDGPEGSVPA